MAANKGQLADDEQLIAWEQMTCRSGSDRTLSNYNPGYPVAGTVGTEFFGSATRRPWDRLID
jgi:hypothetical protein